MKRPVDLILDTDMGNDIDDALALCMLHAMESRGHARLRAVSVSKDNPYAAAYVDLLNSFYGRGDIPVGKVRGGVTPLPEKGDFTREVVCLKNSDGTPVFPTRAGTLGDYPDAVPLLRTVLSAAQDQSIVMVMIGFSTNMAHLFKSQPDAISPLDGHTLFAKKVRLTVVMAANFSDAVLKEPTSINPEYNIRCDIESARAFVENCPSPIHFSGWEIGAAILYPGAAIDSDFDKQSPHPMADAYRRYLPMPYDRPTWDLTAVLHAVCPESYFNLSENGTVRIDSKGYTHFIPHAEGTHQYLKLIPEKSSAICQLFRDLVTQPPTVLFEHKEAPMAAGIPC